MRILLGDPETAALNPVLVTGRTVACSRATAADLVESIDYNETKLYVTYIVEAYAHYELAWGD